MTQPATFVARRAQQLALERACNTLRRTGWPEDVVLAFGTMARAEPHEDGIWRLLSAWTQRDKAKFACTQAGECASCGTYFELGEEHWCLR